MNTTIYDPVADDTTALNALLRGEMAAVETYTRALGLCGDEEMIADLQKIRDDHSRAVRMLRDQVIQLGGIPAEGPDTCSVFGAGVTGAKGAGPTTALAVLRQGEERVISEYQAALDDGDISPECHPMIRIDLLTTSQKHVEELNRLLGGVRR